MPVLSGAPTENPARDHGRGRVAKEEEVTRVDGQRKERRQGSTAMGKQADSIECTRATYPNGDEFWRVSLNRVVIGSVHRVEGGFVPWRSKKPRSFEIAVRDCVLKRVREAVAHAARMSRALDLPIAVGAVDPVDGVTTE
jgi:hypothetical protein